MMNFRTWHKTPDNHCVSPVCRLINKTLSAARWLAGGTVCNSGTPDLAQRDSAWLVGRRSRLSLLVLVEPLVHAPCQQTSRAKVVHFALRCAFDRPVLFLSLSASRSPPPPASRVHSPYVQFNPSRFHFCYNFAIDSTLNFMFQIKDQLFTSCLGLISHILWVITIHNLLIVQEINKL